MTFTRITVRADQMGGVPWIRGLRIRVATVVGMVADGMSERDVLDAYPDARASTLTAAMIEMRQVGFCQSPRCDAQGADRLGWGHGDR